MVKNRDRASTESAADSAQNNTDLNIRMYFERFLDSKITATMDLSLSDVDINPFLISVARNQLNIRTPQDLSRWMITQWLERSMVTSFGSTLQNIAKEFASKKHPSGVTASIELDGTVYHMIIKSGPNHNVPVVRNIRHALLRAQENDPGSIPVFGVCYGDRDVGPIVKKELDGIQILVGRRFWEFISSDTNCYDRILGIASEMGRAYRDPNVGTLGEAIKQKASYLETELKKIYGDKDKDFWRNMLGGNV